MQKSIVDLHCLIWVPYNQGSTHGGIKKRTEQYLPRYFLIAMGHFDVVNCVRYFTLTSLELFRWWQCPTLALSRNFKMVCFFVCDDHVHSFLLHIIYDTPFTVRLLPAWDTETTIHTQYASWIFFRDSVWHQMHHRYVRHSMMKAIETVYILQCYIEVIHAWVVWWVDLGRRPR